MEDESTEHAVSLEKLQKIHKIGKMVEARQQQVREHSHCQVRSSWAAESMERPMLESRSSPYCGKKSSGIVTLPTGSKHGGKHNGCASETMVIPVSSTETWRCVAAWSSLGSGTLVALPMHKITLNSG